MKFQQPSASVVLLGIIYRRMLVTKTMAAAQVTLKIFVLNACNITFYWKTDVFPTALLFLMPEVFCSTKRETQAP